MSLTEQIKRRIDFDSTIDEVYYLKVVHELEAGIKREGLWAKALAESDGDSDKAHAKYIRLRVLSLKEEDARPPKTTSQSPQKTTLSTEGWSSVLIIIVLVLAGIWMGRNDTGGVALERRPDGTVVYSGSLGEYVGELSDNKFNGFGTYTYIDGRTYRGEWKDDQYNGQGTMTYADGRVESGRWKDGKFLGP